MRKDLRYHIGTDKLIVFCGMILMVTTFTMSQNVNKEIMCDTNKVSGYRIINYDLLIEIKQRFPILYTDIMDTIFVYERQRDNSLVLYDKYVYNEVEKNWVSLDENRPRVKISRRDRKDARIVHIKPCKRDEMSQTD